MPLEPYFRTVRDPDPKPSIWLRERPTTSSEIDAFDSQGLVVPGSYWGDILLEAKRQNLVVLKGIDVCTAWCAAKSKLKVVSMVLPENRNPGTFHPSRWPWAFMASVEWTKKHMVPFFEMVERGEMPDMSMLEWLTVMGGFEPEVALACVRRYSIGRKGDPTTLDPRDRERLKAAAIARLEALAQAEKDAAATTNR